MSLQFSKLFSDVQNCCTLPLLAAVILKEEEYHLILWQNALYLKWIMETMQIPNNIKKICKDFFQMVIMNIDLI